MKREEVLAANWHEWTRIWRRRGLGRINTNCGEGGGVGGTVDWVGAWKAGRRRRHEEEEARISLGRNGKKRAGRFTEEEEPRIARIFAD